MLLVLGYIFKYSNMVIIVSEILMVKVEFDLPCISS